MSFFGRRRERREEAQRASADTPERRARIIRAYHEQSKHGPFRYAAGPLDLDWANQPDPFRRYAGAALLELELAPAAARPGYDEALRAGGLAAAPLDRAALSLLLQDSLALSAWKSAGGTRWSLRVNPSSGNLHPTEATLVAPAVPGLWERASVLHYAPREHALELRAELPDGLWERLARGLPEGALLVGLSSIAWREAWKYGERAYRYCQHDVGHAISALRIAAGALGWTAELADALATEELATLLGIAGSSGPEAERAECLLVVRPAATASAAGFAPDAGAVGAFAELEWRGTPNPLSAEHVEWDAIELAFGASAKPRGEPSAAWSAPPAPAAQDRAGISLRGIVRSRRSCLALDARTTMSAADFLRVMEATMPRARRAPFDALPWPPRLDLALFVHRVDGLHPGLYWLARDPERAERARARCRPEFLWEAPPGCPPELPLALLLPMDLRRHATDVSCQQAIAGDGTFSLGMLADFERALDEHGAWIYPRLFWEAGLVGQRLYLEAEALGLRGTGIGCFLDDPMHSILGLQDRSFQSLYHFTVGGAVEDPRLTSLPAYSRP